MNFTPSEWWVLAKVVAAIAVFFLAVLGLIIAVVRWQLGTMSKAQAAIAKKFDEGGEFFELKAKVERIGNLMIHKNPEDTVVVRGVMGANK